MRHNCRRKIRHENVCNLSWSKPNAHTHAHLHTPMRVCVCKHCALGSFGAGWERGGRGFWLIVATPAATLRSLCAPVNGVSHFPFYLPSQRLFTACTLVFFLIARIFAFCILHELNSAQLWGGGGEEDSPLQWSAPAFGGNCSGISFGPLHLNAPEMFFDLFASLRIPRRRSSQPPPLTPFPSIHKQSQSYAKPPPAWPLIDF